MGEGVSGSGSSGAHVAVVVVHALYWPRSHRRPPGPLLPLPAPPPPIHHHAAYSAAHTTPLHPAPPTPPSYTLAPFGLHRLMFTLCI